MATSFQTQNSFSFLFSFITILLLLLNSKVVNSAETVTFTFLEFKPVQQSLVYQGDAVVTSTGHLQLTKVTSTGEPVEHSLGRVLYYSPIHIWDSATGIVGSFVTTFNFTINTPNINEPAEGLAFFLAPVDTLPKKGGGHLGIYPGNAVAIEFDTFFNKEWDTQVPHIGIDVNSVKSVTTAPWGFKSGEVANVIVDYEATTKTLLALISSPSGFGIVSAVVDLTQVLPEFVRVGFSATTGSNKHVETHDIFSWIFLSGLPDSSTDQAFINEKRVPLSHYSVLRNEVFKNNVHLSNYVTLASV